MAIRNALGGRGGGGGARAYAQGNDDGEPRPGAGAPPPNNPNSGNSDMDNDFRAPRQSKTDRAGMPGFPFAGLDPTNVFGSKPSWPSPLNPFFERGAGENREGAGAYGLPPAFGGWSGPARYAFLPALQYAQDAQPAINYFEGEMNRDMAGDLYSLSSDIYEAQAGDAKRRGDQQLAQAGYGGGGTVSPFAGLQVQMEGAARAGALGNAARSSVLQAQQYKNEATRGYLNSISSYMQALLAPALLQSSSSTKAPVGQVTPSLIGPSMNLLGSLINAGAGAASS